ncbi:MAG: hypothetical protein KBB26_00055 [Candidatus Omnitrophica bacterium]|nr:hypothetical protein [Candidatus Omnitrophota bacterium]
MNSDYSITFSLLDRAVNFILIVLGGYLLAWGLGRGKHFVRPRGVTLFGILLIALSVDQILSYRNFPYYYFMFHQLSYPSILARYCLSLLSRGCVVFLGVGLLEMKNWARRGILCLGLLLLAGFPWKHPIYVFINLAELTEQRFPGNIVINPWFGYIFYVGLDILFAVSMLFYFSRPSVKRHFLS